MRGTLVAVWCDDLQPLPEDPVPADIPSEALAPLADHGSRVIWGEGRPGAPLMVVLDNPGLREDGAGRAFVCGTRQTLRSAAASAGLGPEDLYVAFLLKRRPTRAYDRPAVRSAYLPVLREQISRNDPRVLVLMGDAVTDAVLGDGARVKDLRGQVLQVWERSAVVTYHPLAARRRPALLPLLGEALRMAAALVADGVTPSRRRGGLVCLPCSPAQASRGVITSSMVWPCGTPPDVHDLPIPVQGEAFPRTEEVRSDNHPGVRGPHQRTVWTGPHPEVAAMAFQWESIFAEALRYDAFLERYGTEAHRQRWAAVDERVHLNAEQRDLLAGFVRRMPVLCVAGAWCGDCVQQVPILKHIAAAASQSVDLRLIDRDAYPDLRDALAINGGNRVPVTVFLSEDWQVCSVYGDRVLAYYRQMAADRLGASCPTGIVPPGDELLADATAEWLAEFERIQLMLRLTGRLREKHGD